MIIVIVLRIFIILRVIDCHETLKFVVPKQF